MSNSLRLTVASFVVAALHVSADTLYVSLQSTNPVSPYATWPTAATNIQDAVDAAVDGDTVLVTNGVYTVGARDVSVLDTNQQPPQWVSVGLSRVVVTNSIRLESVNGPLVTTIWGGRLTNENGWATNGFRCAYLGANAFLGGFTLTNGFVRVGGGAGLYCESASTVVSNCTLSGNSAFGGSGGGVFGGTLHNCTLSYTNVAYCGGAAYGCTLNNCTLSYNDFGADGAAAYGGGAYECTLYNCMVTGNRAGNRGGGAYRSTLYGCVVTGNAVYGWSASEPQCGGGAYDCTLYNCRLTDNYACSDGGGAAWSSLNNCTLTGNAVEFYGGGAAGCTLYNCTLTGNWAEYGGGASECTLYNCIVYFNTAEVYDEVASQWFANYCLGALNYCCTTPHPGSHGNITNAPLFVNTNDWSDLRQHPDSPCIDAGTNLTGVVSNDILGLPRPMDGNGDGIARFDIGAYEFNLYRFAPTLRLATNGFQFSVCGEPGRSVRIERSRDLVNWEFAGQVPIPIGGQTLIDPAATSESKLFYRAMRVP